ncbi:MAG: NAD(P)/FAD-dependent oxidoreductase [Candidatus Sungiibacteriota bacterium]|uniref:NAD(P)/FAD-dependent oxidoreductase n=1 Tax=Candidatus Sungiibacteriota bacterium TaxID=2750080 RepID=A0A7T5UPN8_9BACT|nr:MAG: NAD(P)/FAD-dependent oxidoreductase [Candidatus Sungbacteria bacterium]
MVNNKQKIVILGAGFGGITAALKLARLIKKYQEYEVVLVDKNYYHLFTPALYEISAIPKEEAHGFKLKSAIVIPVEDIIYGREIKFIQGEIIGLDKIRRAVVVKNAGAVPFEYLLVALGSETNYFNIPGLKENSYPLKGFRDALRIRNKIEALLEQNRPITIVVGGAGSTGIEVIAELSNFICSLQKKLVKNHALCQVRLLVVEASPEIMPGFDNWSIGLVRKRLAKLGIETKTNFTVANVTSQEITGKDNTRLAYDIFIWTGGVTGLSLFKTLGLPLTPKETLAVNQYLEVEPRVFAIGDNAGFINPATGKLLIWNVPVAEAEAKVAVRNIIREISGRKKTAFRPSRKYPFVLTVGKKYAVADLVILRLSGFIGWIIKILVELNYLRKILPLKKAIAHWLRAVKLYRSND